MAKSQFAISLLLILSLLGISSATSVAGTTDENRWSRVNTPAGGEDGGVVAG